MKPLSESSCSCSDYSFISDGANRYETPATGAAPGIRSIWNSTGRAGGRHGKSLGNTFEKSQTIADMSSASSVVTYTSVYTDSKPGRVFWGADEELLDKGSPRVIVYGYDGLPMLPVAPPSPDYITGPEEPQKPPAPLDEDEHELMFIQPHDPDFMLEPIYPEYVAESDPEEDPKEYEEDETEDGPVGYPMDGGDDGDDDDGNSSGYDADDKDEEEEDEEEEHLAPADSAVVIPIDELASPPEGTEPIIPPPSTNTATTGARITIRP
nr:hypothetical protein [Tanacetum cinerariifolium]